MTRHPCPRQPCKRQTAPSSWRHWIDHVRHSHSSCFSVWLRMVQDTLRKQGIGVQRCTPIILFRVGSEPEKVLIGFSAKVLLYNFFEDSSVDVSQWRVVLNVLDDSQKEVLSPPHFDETRHAGVCSEVRATKSIPVILHWRIRIVKISLCCHYEGAKKYVDSRLFGQRRTDAGMSSCMMP